VKFRRKSADPAREPEEIDAAATEDQGDQADLDGPFDVDDVVEDEQVQRVDLGSLLIEPVDGLELQVQVEESSGEVQSVLLAGGEGAVELRAFAAPRGGDLWSEVRPRIAADFAQRGGTATEREGRFGTELVCQVTVRVDDGRTGTQPSRIIGVNGPRWMLRATLLGRPAVEVDAAQEWEDAIARVVVRRGSHAMPVGAVLPLVLPPRDHVVEQD
jgi:hypothetical protein